MSNYVQMTAGYSNTDFTRDYKISGVSSGELPNVKSRILAINASLAGGTDGGLGDFFRADDYDASDPEFIIGKFTGITAAQIVSEEKTEINLNV